MLFECKNLSVRYKKCDDFVFYNVSIALDKAETLIITGENGSGKSTLINAAVGMLGTKCEVNGDIFINGTRVEQNKRKAMRELRSRTISVMPQDVYGSFNPAQRIGIQLKSIIKQSKKIDDKDIKNYIYSLLDGLGFYNTDKILRSYPHELSLGMLARCMFAVSLANKPELLILDEPNASLNEELRNEIMRKTAEYQQKSKCGIIIITHHKEDTDMFFENCWHLHMGENND